jgi:carbonic anhydrase
METILATQFFGTRHFMLIKHTDCGGFYITGPKMIEDFKAHAKTPEAINSLPPGLGENRGFGDHTIEQVVLGDVEFLRNSPLIYKDTTISGWVHDDDTGKVSLSMSDCNPS